MEATKTSKKSNILKASARVKKREIPLSNEVTQIARPALHVSGSYGDRFIPRRSAGFSDPACHFLRARHINTDILSMKDKEGFWRLHKMDVLLCKIFEIPTLSKARLLNFSDNFRDTKTEKQVVSKNDFRLDWDCKPRKKPTTFIEAIHDLPSLKNYLGKHVIDWSKKNEIVAVLNSKMVMWTLFTEKTTAYMLYALRAVAFDVTGNYLALAMCLNRKPVLQVWDTKKYDKRYLIYTEELKCYSELTNSEISALIWDSNRNIMCGTCCGTVFIFNLLYRRVLHILRHALSSAVIEMRFSCNFKFLATADASHQICIFYWDGVKLYVHSKVNRESNISMEFHPWKNGELVVAEEFPARLVLIDVARRQSVAGYRDKLIRCSILNISFNKTTAELCVSVVYKDTEKCEILVLGAMDRVVDVLVGHEQPVQHMVWSPDGKILATAGDDQTFILWNFFGKPNLEKECRTATRVMEKESNRSTIVHCFRKTIESKLYQSIR